MKYEITLDKKDVMLIFKVRKSMVYKHMSLKPNLRLKTYLSCIISRDNSSLNVMFESPSIPLIPKNWNIMMI